MAPSLLNFDIWVMLAVGAGLPAGVHDRPRDRALGGRLSSSATTSAYVAYLILAAQQHDALRGLLRGDAELRAAAHDRDAGGDGDPRPAVARRRPAPPMHGLTAADPASWQGNGTVVIDPRRASRTLLLLLIAVSFLTGCAVTNRLFRDRAAEERAAALLQLQLSGHALRRRVRRAGRRAGRSRSSRPTDDPGERLAAQSWLVSQATGAFTIAAGPEPGAERHRHAGVRHAEPDGDRGPLGRGALRSRVPTACSPRTRRWRAAPGAMPTCS
ncbi:MAG: hypothetical protein MZW92_59155 [Comamonadaceae bacterium]|nr:hypothetical protein [Comamonadaceae bacterium]